MALATAAAIAGGTALISGALSFASNKKKEKEAARKKAELEKKIAQAEANRQPVLDNSEDLRNLKQGVSNPYANLAVATQAAEFEAEQQDMALANTLDAMVSSGASAGGATALARAAMQGRKGISAGLEQQEISNQKKAADGEKQMQQELRSIEVSALNEEANAFNRREKREDATIGRLEEKEDFYTQQEVAYGDAATEALVGTVSNVGSAVAGNISGGTTVF